MTANQVSYWTLQESKRHNVSTEAETTRHNVVTEGETNRHNIATENEANRHNISIEAETYRHNVETEKYNISALNETKRHNLATEQTQSFVANQNAKYQQQSVALQEQRQANDHFYNLSKLAEETRHNQAYESYQGASLRETKRTNIANEGIKSVTNAISSAKQKAEAKYQETLNTLQRSKDMYGNQLTVRQIQKIDADISKMRNDHKIAQQRANIDGWNALFNSATNVGKTAAQIGGKRK